MNGALDENRFDVDFGEAFSRIGLAFPWQKPIRPKSIVMTVDAFDGSGVSVAANCKGATYSNVLESMYAYVPATESPGLHLAVELEFLCPPSRISVQFLSWPERQPLRGSELHQGIFLATLCAEETDGGMPNTRVLSVLGGAK